jgi:hypothetical protein
MKVEPFAASVVDEVAPGILADGPGEGSCGAAGILVRGEKRWKPQPNGK